MQTEYTVHIDNVCILTFYVHSIKVVTKILHPFFCSKATMHIKLVARLTNLITLWHNNTQSNVFDTQLTENVRNFTNIRVQSQIATII